MPLMPQGMREGMPGGAMAPMQTRPSAPVSQLPDSTAVQQTQYRQAALTAAQMAAQADPSSAPTATTEKKQSSGWRPFWSTSSDK
jgi:hypothetical protein